MHATQLLDTYLRKPCQGVHKRRMHTLLTLSTALMTGKKLSVTGLGRAICNDTHTKHNIKRADRLIGNAAMHQDRPVFYQALAKHMIGPQRRPVILIDWSDLSADREFHLLRASIPVDGRALTIYEESHHQRNNGNPRVQKRFLMTLKTILPRHCHPLIVTDAGFRTPWFRAVQDMGWDFVGRVGGHMMLSPQGGEDWVRVEQVFETATARGRYMGEIDLARKNPLTCHAYLLKKQKKGRVKKTVFGQRCAMKHSEKNAHRERTPWLIVTSLDKTYANSKQIINLYKTRMQIEEGFRDIKNSRWGLAFSEARCTSTYRYENLLLVAHLATFVVWMIGKIAEIKQWHRHYQANTVKTEKVLSTFFLGLEVIKRGADDFLKQEFIEAIKQLKLQHNRVCGYV
jgi:hypothetical protein